MERSQKTNLGLIVLIISAPACALDYPARHDHLRGGCAGMLSITAEGVRFAEIGGKGKHQHNWTWADIQQFEVGDARRVRVLSYSDQRLLAGRDKEFEFTLDAPGDLRPAYQMLRGLLDGRFVARLADRSGEPLWKLPVKSRRGAQGELAVYAGRVVFATAVANESRTWRDDDITAVSSSGPFDLTIDTFEQNGTFVFQLREALKRELYDALWLRLNGPQGLPLISTRKDDVK